MDNDDKTFLVIRIIGALAGLLGGAVSGTLLLILLMVFTGSTFGLSNVWPGPIGGALLGALIGFFCPKMDAALARILHHFPP